MEKQNAKVINFNFGRGGKTERQLKVIKDIAIESGLHQMADQKTVAWSVGLGIAQGLKYQGSFSRGAKSGLAVYGVLVGANIVMNLARNADRIRNA